MVSVELFSFSCRSDLLLISMLMHCKIDWVNDCVYACSQTCDREVNWILDLVGKSNLKMYEKMIIKMWVARRKVVLFSIYLTFWFVVCWWNCSVENLQGELKDFPALQMFSSRLPSRSLLPYFTEYTTKIKSPFEERWGDLLLSPHTLPNSPQY